MCNSLKHLQKLQAYYKGGTLPNFKNLRQLENLAELHLSEYMSNFELTGVDDFNYNVYKLLPKLKVYTISDWLLTEVASTDNLNKLTPCALEQFAADFRTPRDM